MKEFPDRTESLLSGPVIEPCFLIEITLDETLHLSTRQRYEYQGITYEPGLVLGLSLDIDRVAFEIINQDYQHTNSVLLGHYQRAPVRVWWVEGLEPRRPLIQPGYVAPGYYDEDYRYAPTLIFRGNVSEFNPVDKTLGITATRSASRRYPTKRVLPPIANFTRPEGTVLVLGGSTYRLESRG